MNRVTQLLRHLPAEPADVSKGTDALIDEMLAQAHAELERVAFDDAWLIERIAGFLPSGPLDEALRQLRAGDLALAGRCAEGDPQAVALAIERYRYGLSQTLQRRGFGDVADDVLQEALERAFVGPEPDIAHYAGRGPLGRWLQTLVVRTALNKRRGQKCERLGEDDRLFERATEADDPEIGNLKRHYRGAFKEAFQVAFFSLEPRERNVLRYLYLDRLNIDAIGKIYGVHRATVARWRTQARERLNQQTRSHLSNAHRLSPAELDSIVDLIESQMEVSLSRILAEGEGGRS